MKSIVIIGTGQLGRRYAQSLASFSGKLQITLVDNNPSSLDAAKDFLEPLLANNMIVKTIYQHDCQNISSVIRSNNTIGVQFHPEKSRQGGLELLKSFVATVN